MTARWLVVLLSMIGCTQPNPRSCLDGVCEDPGFPFCDVDGAFEGHAKLCIAVTESGLAFYQQNSPNVIITVENNVMYSTSSNATNVLQCGVSGCSVGHNVVWPQSSPLHASNIIADPRIVDPNADFRLQAESPAIDAAVFTLASTTDHDFDGTPRPQGAKPDIGAYERVPQ